MLSFDIKWLEMFPLVWRMIFRVTLNSELVGLLSIRPKLRRLKNNLTRDLLLIIQMIRFVRIEVKSSVPQLCRTFTVVLSQNNIQCYKWLWNTRFSKLVERGMWNFIYFVYLKTIRSRFRPQTYHNGILKSYLRYNTEATLTDFIPPNNFKI